LEKEKKKEKRRTFVEIKLLKFITAFIAEVYQ
jgi:hypothetical protein